MRFFGIFFIKIGSKIEIYKINSRFLTKFYKILDFLEKICKPVYKCFLSSSVIIVRMAERSGAQFFTLYILSGNCSHRFEPYRLRIFFFYFLQNTEIIRIFLFWFKGHFWSKDSKIDSWIALQIRLLQYFFLSFPR